MGSFGYAQDGVGPRIREDRRGWIPAFAGMTEGGGGRDKREKRRAGQLARPLLWFPLVGRLGDDYPCLVGVDPVGRASLNHVLYLVLSRIRLGCG